MHENANEIRTSNSAFILNILIRASLLEKLCICEVKQAKCPYLKLFILNWTIHNGLSLNNNTLCRCNQSTITELCVDMAPKKMEKTKRWDFRWKEKKDF